MPRAFVTGIGGFLGSRLATSLLTRGFEVTGTSRRPPLALSHLPEPLRLVQGDLLTDGAWQEAMAGADVVIHAAAATGRATRSEHVRVNVVGTDRVLDAAGHHGIRRLVFVSSIATTFAKIDRYYYALAKRRAETVVRTNAAHAVIVRPTIIVGRGSAVLDGLRKLAGLPLIPIFGDGSPSVQPVFVDDAADAIATIAADPAFDGRTLPLGGADVISIEEFVVAIARHIGRSHPRTLHLPLPLVLPLLAAGETIAYAAMPITVGQLATFRCDGTADGGGPPDIGRPYLGVHAMLERSL